MENNPYSSPVSDVFGTSSITDAAQVSEGVVSQLRRTKGWVQFLSVISFLGAAWMVLMGIAMLVGSSAISRVQPQGSPFPIGPLYTTMGFFYIGLAVAYLYPGIKLWKYGSRIGQLTRDRALFTLEAALNEQRAFWKYAGSMTLVMIGLMVAIFVGAVIFSATQATRGV